MAEDQARHLRAVAEDTEDGEHIEGLWSVKKTAAFLGIPEGTIYQWVSTRRELTSYKVGRRRMFKPADVRAYLREHMTEPAAS